MTYHKWFYNLILTTKLFLNQMNWTTYHVYIYSLKFQYTELPI